MVDERVLKKDNVKSCKRAVDALKSVLKDSGSESDSTPDLSYSASSPNEASLIKSGDVMEQPRPPSTITLQSNEQSSDDISGRSMNAELVTESFLEYNRREAIRVLTEVFRRPRLELETADVDSDRITRITDSSIGANNSDQLGSSTSPQPDRQDDLIAPPLPVTKLLHPTRKRDQSEFSQMVAQALKDARNRTSSPKLNLDEDSDLGSLGAAGDPLAQYDDEFPEPTDLPPPVISGPSRFPHLPPVSRANANPRTSPNAIDDERGNVDENDVDVFNSSQELPVEKADQERLLAFREQWSNVFLDASTSWDEFSEQCVQFATAARELASDLRKPKKPNTAGSELAPRPPPRRPPAGQPISRFDPTEARRIQGLYRHSKKRAARKLMNDNVVTYSGTIEQAESYFTEIFEEKRANPSVLGEGLNTFVPNAKDHEQSNELYDQISSREVSAKLKSAANTAPGSDRCEYSHLKKVDPGAQVLTLIFNRCHREKDVPAPWKEALTVLIYKKGDEADISNLRPIALMSVIYKLFMAVWAKRLKRWSIEAGVLSTEQKSARPTEGCYEHTYLLKSLVADARRRKQKLFLAWLDIRNAFGSVPHNTIRSTLRHIGVPPDLVTLIMNAYTGASSVIKTPQGNTNAIPLRAGVKQGCPLSPILFNLCIELILRMVKDKAAKLKSGSCSYHGAAISCLAYADDLVIIARSQKALQKLLNQASDGATILGFYFRPDKCASLSLVTNGRTTVRTEVNDFLIQGSAFPALQQEQSYRYLGVPIGLIHNIDDIPNIVPRLIRDLEAIRTSLLAPWQKLDAIRTFIQPCLTYALRAGNPLKQSLCDYRSLLVKAIREICSLPNRATANYIFASKAAGGLAFQDPTKESDLQAIVQALRILSSADDNVRRIATEELKKFVRNTTQSAPTAELITKYLSAADDPRLQKLNYSTHSSLWSRVRLACRRQNVTFVFSEQNPHHVLADGSEAIESRKVTTFLHRLTQQRYADALMSLPDQGKVARCLIEDQYVNGSSWHMNGLNIRFKDWRFVHRARLNVVPLNANKSRFSRTSPTCRHCSQPETLPHVICHCRPQMTQIRDRHNKIVQRIVNAVRFGEIQTDKAIRDSGSRLRPDIVVKDNNHVLIIDVTCPFDNDANALSEAAQHKFTKYEQLKQHFIAQGLHCEVYPFVIGALGSWYKKNELLCTKLGMTRRYKSLFRKLCCSDAIQGSTNIYRLHLGWDDAALGTAEAARSLNDID